MRRLTDMDQNTADLKSVAAEAFAALCGGRQIPPFSSRAESLRIDEAYRVTPLVRQMYEAGGAKVLGRKIGFTNRTIWAEYGVYAPIWGYVFDRSLHDLASVETLPLAPFPEPRIEPEIVFGLASPPTAQMDEAALSSCIAWVALGFEIVQSIFPGWKFSAAENFHPGKIDCTISKPSATHAMHDSKAVSSIPGEGEAARPNTISGSMRGSENGISARVSTPARSCTLRSNT